MIIEPSYGRRIQIDPDGPEYIRIDAVKEREAKLIEVSIHRGNSFGFDDDFETEKRFIYEEAQLEELK